MLIAVVLVGAAAARCIGAIVEVPGDRSTIGEAIEATASGDTIWIAPGTYTGPGNYNLVVTDKVLVLDGRGAFGAVVIDCSGPEPLRWAMQIRRFFETAHVTLHNLTIRGANAAFGAVHCGELGELVLTNCVLEQNGFHAPEGWASGGALHLEYGSKCMATDCAFMNNGGRVGDLGYGGAIHVDSGQCTLVRCLIEGNAAEGGGGVWVQQYGSLRMVDTVVRGNAAYDAGGVGVVTMFATMVAENCVIAENRSDNQAGGVWVSDSYCRAVGCTISGNRAMIGGGIHTDLAILDVSNSIIWGNCADVAGTESIVTNSGFARLICCDVDSTGLAQAFELAMDATTQFGDPEFCGALPCESGGDYSLNAGSPCTPDHSLCGARIGALDVGCSPPDPTGACCLRDAGCIEVTEVQCEGGGGRYVGDGIPCRVDLCPVVPVEPQSWGRIKSRFSDGGFR